MGEDSSQSGKMKLNWIRKGILESGISFTAVNQIIVLRHSFDFASFERKHFILEEFSMSRVRPSCGKPLIVLIWFRSAEKYGAEKPLTKNANLWLQSTRISLAISGSFLQAEWEGRISIVTKHRSTKNRSNLVAARVATKCPGNPKGNY